MGVFTQVCRLSIRFGSFLAAALGLLAAGCSPAVIEGTVADVKGDALPGVAVRVEGTNHEALTDAVGTYQVYFKPGTVQLSFFKTGYTPGRLELDVDAPRQVQAAQVVLWPLPVNKGVYLYEDFRYRELTRIKPSLFVPATGAPAYGTRRWAGIETVAPAPLILCFFIPPRRGAKLCRLQLAEMTLREARGGDDTVNVWVAGTPIPMAEVPIDGIDGHLVQIKPVNPLSPGAYAIHWGALDGQSDSEPLMFFFSVGEDFSPIAAANEDTQAADESDEAPEKAEPGYTPAE
jgi:Carboxypeptidase regulatory-like domain